MCFNTHNIWYTCQVYFVLLCPVFAFNIHTLVLNKVKTFIIIDYAAIFILELKIMFFHLILVYGRVMYKGSVESLVLLPFLINYSFTKLLERIELIFYTFHIRWSMKLYIFGIYYKHTEKITFFQCKSEPFVIKLCVKKKIDIN